MLLDITSCWIKSESENLSLPAVQIEAAPVAENEVLGSWWIVIERKTVEFGI